MARGPEEVLKLTTEDLKALEIMENYIDNHPNMEAFNGYFVKIDFSTTISEKCLNTRYSVRTDELTKRYKAAGWKEVILTPHNSAKSIELRRYETSSGGYYDR